MSLRCCREHNRQLDTRLLVGSKHLWAAASMFMHMWVRSPCGDIKVYIVYYQTHDNNFTALVVCAQGPVGRHCICRLFCPHTAGSMSVVSLCVPMVKPQIHAPTSEGISGISKTPLTLLVIDNISGCMPVEPFLR